MRDAMSKDKAKHGGWVGTINDPLTDLLRSGARALIQQAIEAECINIGDGGLFAILPINVPVAIGQRYTFRLNIGERGPEPGSRQRVSQQGEIIRLELLLGQTGYADRIGIGVRLFGPRCGIVPMPAVR